MQLGLRGRSSMENPKNAVQGQSLGQALIEAKLITAEQLAYAIESQRKHRQKLGQILVEEGLVAPADLATVESIRLNVPFIDLKRHKVQPGALRLIPEETAKKHTLIPLDVVADALLVVMADPEDVRTIEDLQTQAGMRVEVALGIPSEIREAINLSYRAGGEIEGAVAQFAPAIAKREEAPVTLDLLAQTPVVQTLDILIAQAVRDRASDIHIEPQEDRLRIRYRIDGILRDVYSLPLGIHAPLVSRVKILAEMNIADQRRSQDGQISLRVEDRAIDLRIATVGTVHGERVALRILDKSLALFTLSELGFLSEALKKYKEMLESPYGMILVSGPTGSGKTTTLYASVNDVDRNEHNIMTIEDPIEYRFLDISQIQTNPKAGITFADGLRTILRHDPDVILVGEIRDSDTARTAAAAALTGHQVLSSIHANDAVGVLFRLVDLGIEPYLISNTLIGVVGQRMVRRICPHCFALSQPSREESIAYYLEIPEERTTFYRGAGCNFCSNTGYLGRTGIFEVLVMSGEIRQMLVAKASAGEIRAQALREGMVTLRRDGMLKVKEGITTSYEVLRNTVAIG